MKRTSVFIYDVYEVLMRLRPIVWTLMDEEAMQFTNSVDKIIEDWFKLVLQRIHNYNVTPQFMHYLPSKLQNELLRRLDEEGSVLYRTVRVPDELSVEEVTVRLWRDDLYLVFDK